ncbi:DUF2238 domain-containing protein [Vreelandella titanicae]|uniref:DUF2238 domain-containing protein n=1 Tax=Vreelandella titanicae TaxID=664683 RepID=UPI00382EA844
MAFFDQMVDLKFVIANAIYSRTHKAACYLDSLVYYLMPVMIILLHAALYELIKWLMGITFPNKLGQAYLGAQGDICDGQKDMILDRIDVLLANT